jgi:hypothetical protein
MSEEAFQACASRQSDIAIGFLINTIMNTAKILIIIIDIDIEACACSMWPGRAKLKDLAMD